jgi:hypothetical protein
MTLTDKKIAHMIRMSNELNKWSQKKQLVI